MAAPHISLTLSDAKREARLRAKAARGGSDPALGEKLARVLMQRAPPPEGAVVAGFLPVGDEIDIQPLLLLLHARGHKIVLPATPPRGSPLIFRRWQPGTVLIPERFGTRRPDGPERTPSYLLIPLLAFDRRGGRLGYGAGYYDRTLAGLPGATKIGCAYAAQEVALVPTGPHDIALDAVATEREFIGCTKARQEF